jgi:hypothetical protein
MTSTIFPGFSTKWLLLLRLSQESAPGIGVWMEFQPTHWLAHFTSRSRDLRHALTMVKNLSNRDYFSRKTQSEINMLSNTLSSIITQSEMQHRQEGVLEHPQEDSWLGKATPSVSAPLHFRTFSTARRKSERKKTSTWYHIWSQMTLGLSHTRTQFPRNMQTWLKPFNKTPPRR